MLTGDSVIEMLVSADDPRESPGWGQRECKDGAQTEGKDHRMLD